MSEALKTKNGVARSKISKTSDADRILALMSEFTKKLLEIQAVARGILSTWRESQQQKSRAVPRLEMLALQESFDRLFQPVQKLALTASAWIEHRAFDELIQLELELRLADLEAATFGAQELISGSARLEGW